MTANGSNEEAFPPADVLAALVAMKANAREGKERAHSYLEKFQKSRDAWATTLSIVKSGSEPDAKLFAAITLRGKITYDLSEVPQADLPALRNEILFLLKHFSTGPKPIRVALSVCLAILALQMMQWKDVLSVVVSSLSGSAEGNACILDFLRVLPEEAIDYRKMPITADELNDRVTELVSSNTDYVLRLLLEYSQASPTNSQNPQLFECITSWLREIHVAAIVKSPLIDVVFNGLDSEQTTHQAAECICSLLGDTNENENVDCMELLYPRVVALGLKLQKAALEEEVEIFKAITKITAKAAQSWCVSIARHPNQFRPLVLALLDCAASDKNLYAIDVTFDFWYDLMMYLTIDKYVQSRMDLLDVFEKLVGILLERLQYPMSEGLEMDLFDGDREQEDKFREFRHSIGDVLKVSADVVGISACLSKFFDVVKAWLQGYRGQASDLVVPNWQALESALFAMRAVGTKVSRHEDEVLHELMPLLVQIPDHNKLRFAATMVFGRYTEWTAVHPEFLEAQFNYVIQSFNSGDKDVNRAAASSLRYFCSDCSNLLSGQVVALQAFYDGVIDKLPDGSRVELTEGVATVVGIQPNASVYKLLKLYCDPLILRLMKMADVATSERAKLDMADHIQLLTTFVSNVTPKVDKGEVNQAVVYWREVFPVLTTVLDNFFSFPPILEKLCRCWRSMILSYRTAMTPLLPEMANRLVSGFQSTHEGGFLWVTAAILSEFSEHRDNVDPEITNSIYDFFETQTVAFLRFLNDVPPVDLPDVIEDFFQLATEALLHYPHRFVSSSLLEPVFGAATYALVLGQRDPVQSTLHFIRDVLTYGSENPASSNMLSVEEARQVQGIIRSLLETHGEQLIKKIMAGLFFHFHDDLYSSATGVLASMLEIMPGLSSVWLRNSLELLPAVTASDTDLIMTKVKEQIHTGGVSAFGQLRRTMDNFAFQYRRRHVAPRDGLGQLEAARFRFEG